MLPPKSHSPMKALLVLLALAGVAAGGWATRAQWMPLAGLQAAAPPPADAASSAAATASEPAPEAAPASVAVAAAAPSTPTPASTVANDAAASAPASPASETVAVAPAPEPEARPTPHPAHAKAVAAAGKPAPGRPSNFVLPPPVLPPADEAQVGAAAPAVARPPADQSEPAAVAATATPSVKRALGPREACADQEPSKIAACVRRLCDSEPRYQHFPVCQRVLRKEQQQRGTSE